MNPVESSLPSAALAATRTFMCACLLDAFASTIGPELSMVIGMDKSRATVPAHLSSAFALISILNAIPLMCATAAVDDEESLEDLLDDILVQFSTAHLCRPQDAMDNALEILDLALKNAGEEARAGLAEANAGFPVSGGDFTRWKAVAAAEYILLGEVNR